MEHESEPTKESTISVEKDRMQQDISICSEIEQSNRIKRINGKKLRNIRKQMEFYFSDANLRKDRMLGQLVQADRNGYVDVKVFLSFNKIRMLTDQQEHIIKAVMQSPVLEINESFTKIRRIDPFVSNEVNYSDQTIYVEKLPAHADHKFIRNVFQRFGDVTYVSLPHFRNSQKHKGFAFVEFSSPEDVEKACEGFKVFDDEENRSSHVSIEKIHECKEKFLPSKNKENSAKLSRKRKRIDNDRTPEKKKTQVIEELEDTSKSTIQKSSRKRKQESNEKEPVSKTLRLSHAHDDDDSKVGHDDNLVSLDVEKNTGDSSQNIDNSEQATKDTQVMEDTKQNLEDTKLNLEDFKLNLEDTKQNLEDTEQTMKGTEKAKKDSEKVKDSMVDSKQKAEVTKQNIASDVETIANGKDTNETASCDNQETQDAAGVKSSKRKKKKISDGEKLKLRVMSMVEWRMYRNRYLTMQRKAMASIKKMLLIDSQQRSTCDSLLHRSSSSTAHGETSNEHSQIVKSSCVTFQEGVIVKLTVTKNDDLPAAEELGKKIRNSLDNVAYADSSKMADLQMYLRFKTPESASSSLDSEIIKEFGVAEVLAGDDESNYWKKLEEDRQVQRNRPRRKQRGRDKVIMKATKLMERKNKHIFFEN